MKHTILPRNDDWVCGLFSGVLPVVPAAFRLFWSMINKVDEFDNQYARSSLLSCFWNAHNVNYLRAKSTEGYQEQMSVEHGIHVKKHRESTKSRKYLHCRTKNLNKTIKNTCFFCFKDLPMHKTLIYGYCSNWLSFTKANIFTNTVYKCINTLLQEVYC